MKYISLFEQFVNEAASSMMTDDLKVKSGDKVTVVAMPVKNASALKTFVNSLGASKAWMAEKSVFGVRTLWAAFKNLSQSDFDELKSEFPTAEVADLDMYTSMKTKEKAVADGKKLSKLQKVEDTYYKY